jgi:hypothetical protein
MHMSRLAQLHQSMKSVQLARMRFPLQHAHLAFMGIFLTDTQPKYQLGLACLSHNFTLLFDVDHHYDLVAYIHDEAARKALLKALNLGRGGAAFSTSAFLQQIDAALPTTAHAHQRATPADLVYFQRNVEEAHKIYLCGWWDNALHGEHVRPKNLAKTRAWIDEATYLWCKKYDISTCWTDDPSKALSTINRPAWKHCP